MSKKIMIALIIAVLVFIGFVSYKALKGNEKIDVTSEQCFEMEGNKIISYKEICGSKVNIPSKIKGVEVKEIGSRVFKEKGITNLVLPDTLEIIGISAFEGNSIERLEIPSSVKNIKPYAFYKNKLKEIKMENVETIGVYAFNDNQLKDGFIYGKSKDIIIGYAGKERDNVKIPENVTTIHISALAGCDIKKITLNKKLERIEAYAFENNLLESIEIPESVSIIGSEAFRGNDLENVIVKGKKSKEEFSLFDDSIDNNIIKYE